MQLRLYWLPLWIHPWPNQLKPNLRLCFIKRAQPSPGLYLKDFVCGRPWLDRSLIYRDASSNKIKYHKVRIRPIRFNPYWPSIISFYFKRNINLSTVSLSCTFDTLFFFWAGWGRWLQFQQCNLNKDLRSKKMLKIFISTIFSKHIKCQTRKMTWSFFNKDFLCPLFIYCMISRLVHWVWIMFFIQ